VRGEDLGKSTQANWKTIDRQGGLEMQAHRELFVLCSDILNVDFECDGLTGLQSVQRRLKGLNRFFGQTKAGERLAEECLSLNSKKIGCLRAAGFKAGMLITGPGPAR
jgi:hypothetical protein